MFYRFLITEISYQSGLTKMAAVNFLASKMKQLKLDAVFFRSLDRRVNDVTVKFFTSLSNKTNKFHVVVCLFSNRSQKTSKCGKNISDTLA